jgi:hypothetical protein
MRLPMPFLDRILDNEDLELSEDVLDLDDTHVGNFLDVNYEISQFSREDDSSFYETLQSEYNELFDEIEIEDLVQEIEGELWGRDERNET